MLGQVRSWRWIMRNRWIRIAAMLSLAVVCAAPATAQEPGSVVASDPRVQGRTYTFINGSSETLEKLFSFFNIVRKDQRPQTN
jgi:hypothetical protein